MNTGVKRQLQGVLLALTASVLGACASVPAIVDGPIDPMATLPAVRANEAMVAGQTVRWGGFIARVHNIATGTQLEIVGQGLTRIGRPNGRDETDGRFIAEFPQFLDPLIFKVGRAVTVIGSLQRIQEGKIGEHSYRFPLLQATGAHLWNEYNVHEDFYMFPGPYYRDPFWHGPFWRPPVIIHRERSGNNGGSSVTPAPQHQPPTRPESDRRPTPPPRAEVPRSGEPVRQTPVLKDKENYDTRR